METQQRSQDERRLWLYAFAILLLVSLWMLLMRIFNNPFLLPEFEITVVYMPTVLAGMITLYLFVRARPGQ